MFQTPLGFSEKNNQGCYGHHGATLPSHLVGFPSVGPQKSSAFRRDVAPEMTGEK